MAVPITSSASLVSYLGDGATRDYTFAFPYLDPSHVFAFVDDVAVAYQFLAQGQVRLGALPVSGSTVTIRRITPSVPVTPIPDGGVITPELLQDNENQARFIAEEARDLAEPALRYNPAIQAYDAKGRRIGRVGNATLNDDALTKARLQVEVARYVGGDALATLVEEMTGLGVEIHNDRIDVDLKAIQMAADSDAATALAAAAAAGPDGAELVRRITEYLGSDAWTSGGDDGDVFIPAAGNRQYWRFHLINVGKVENNLQYVSLTNIEFREAPGVAQPATGGTVFSRNTAGSTWGDQAKPFTYPTDLDNGAFDGLTNAQATASPSYIGYQFATPKTIREVSITPHVAAQGMRKFAVEYSDNGSTWTVAGQFTEINWIDRVASLYAIPASGAHTYWRLRVIEVTRPDATFTLREMQFRETAGVPETHAAEPTQYVAPLGGTQWNTTYLFDGDASSTAVTNGLSVADYGTSTRANTVYVTLGFAAPRKVAEVALTVDDFFVGLVPPGDFDIQYSDNGSTWTTALEVRDEIGWVNNETRVYTLPTVEVPGNSATYVYDDDAVFTRPGKGRIAFIQAWGAGGANNGGGGAYREKFVRLRSLPNTVNVTVGKGAADASGGTSTFGSYLEAFGGEASGRGANTFGPGVPYTGEGLYGPSPTGGIYAGGGGSPTGTGASSLYGGGGGGPIAGGQSKHGGNGGFTGTPPTAPAGGGGPSQPGANGRVQVTVW